MNMEEEHLLIFFKNIKTINKTKHIMENLFISTVRYEKVMENGFVKTVNEQYLIDALSFTEAEARTIDKLSPFMQGEFAIHKIAKPRISELILSDHATADRYYKVKVALTTLDEKTGNEKKTNKVILVQACDLKNAYDCFIEAVKNSMTEYEIISISETAILEYYPF